MSSGAKGRFSELEQEALVYPWSLKCEAADLSDFKPELKIQKSQNGIPRELQIEET